MNPLDPLRELEKELRDEMKLFERHSTAFGAVFNAMTACISRVIERMEKAATPIKHPVQIVCSTCGADWVTSHQCETKPPQPEAPHICSDCGVSLPAKEHFSWCSSMKPQPEARWTIDSCDHVFHGDKWIAGFMERADAEAFVAMKEGRK